MRAGHPVQRQPGRFPRHSRFRSARLRRRRRGHRPVRPVRKDRNGPRGRRQDGTASPVPTSGVVFVVGQERSTGAAGLRKVRGHFRHTGSRATRRTRRLRRAAAHRRAAFFDGAVNNG